MEDIAFELLDFPTQEPGLVWALVKDVSANEDDRHIATVKDGVLTEVIGHFDAKTGNVWATETNEDEDAPAVLNVGDPHDDTGQLKALQPQGNYLRVCRWDRLESAPALAPEAVFRTLPQCGCGGYLGTPRFFKTFAEMSAYVFCMFCTEARPAGLESDEACSIELL